jgi:hypothetical protein
MIKLMNWFMLSCRKATELTEKESLTGLKRTEKIQLFMHTSMCDACSLYYKQSHFIDNILEHQSNQESEAKEPAHRSLSAAAKKELISKLEKE